MRRRIPALALALACLAAAPAEAIEFQSPPQQIVTGSHADSLAVADVTGDGQDDVLLTTAFRFDEVNDHKLIVYSRSPNGLSEVDRHAHNSTNGSTTVAAGDFDGDGDADAAVGHNVGIDGYQQAGGELTGPVALGSAPVGVRRLLAADLDADAADELVVSHPGGVTVGNRSDAGWSWTSLGVPATADVAAGDVTGDGRMDLVAAGQKVYTLIQRPDGGFDAGEAVSFDDPGGVGIGDVTGDGIADAVVSRERNSPWASLYLYRGTSAGLAQPEIHPVYDIPEPVLVTDMNGDARKDVVTVHGGFLAWGVLFQQSSGLLATERRWALPYATSYEYGGAIVTDLNGDGRRDLVVADYNHGLVIARQLPPVPPPSPAPSPGPTTGTSPSPTAAPITTAPPKPTPTPTPTATPTELPITALPQSGPLLRLKHPGGLRVKVTCRRTCWLRADAVLTAKGRRPLRSRETTARIVEAGASQVIRFSFPRAALRRAARRRRPYTLRVRVRGEDPAYQEFKRTLVKRLRRL